MFLILLSKPLKADRVRVPQSAPFPRHPQTHQDTVKANRIKLIAKTIRRARGLERSGAVLFTTPILHASI